VWLLQKEGQKEGFDELCICFGALNEGLPLCANEQYSTVPVYFIFYGILASFWVSRRWKIWRKMRHATALAKHISASALPFLSKPGDEITACPPSISWTRKVSAGRILAGSNAHPRVTSPFGAKLSLCSMCAMRGRPGQSPPCPHAEPQPSNGIVKGRVVGSQLSTLTSGSPSGVARRGGLCRRRPACLRRTPQCSALDWVVSGNHKVKWRGEMRAGGAVI
jgi:hypothetical protein